MAGSLGWVVSGVVSTRGVASRPRALRTIPQLGRAIDTIRREVLAVAPDDGLPTFDGVLSAASEDRPDEPQLDGVVRQVMRAMFEERRARHPRSCCASRRVIGAGLGLSAAMFVLAAGLLIARGIYLSSVPNSKLPADAAAALFDTLVRSSPPGCAGCES